MIFIFTDPRIVAWTVGAPIRASGRSSRISPSLKSRLARQTALESRAGLGIRSREAIRHLSAHFRGHGALMQIATFSPPKCSHRAKSAESGTSALVRAAISLKSS